MDRGMEGNSPALIRVFSKNSGAAARILFPPFGNHAHRGLFVDTIVEARGSGTEYHLRKNSLSHTFRKVSGGWCCFVMRLFLRDGELNLFLVVTVMN